MRIEIQQLVAQCGRHQSDSRSKWMRSQECQVAGLVHALAERWCTMVRRRPPRSLIHGTDSDLGSRQVVQRLQRRASEQTAQTQWFNTASPGATVGHEAGGYKGDSKWKLYDEKFILPPVLASNRYDGRKPLEWLQDIRDYMAGRHEEMDSLLNWIERAPSRL